MQIIDAFLNALASLPSTYDAVIFGFAVLLLIVAIVLGRRLSQAAKMKQEFITIIAHKFRTPLTYIKWSSDSLMEKEMDPYTKQGLHEIVHANESLINLTSTLLELTESDTKSRSQYSFGRLNLCDFVHEVAEGYKDMFHQKNIFFSVACQDSKVMVKIDKARMEFVLQVIFENAIIYTPTGRNVEVVVGRLGSKAVISVTDHGIGMDPRTLSRLFTKFYRAENARRIDTEGFGVGLYLARSVVRRHGGKLEAFSEGLDAGSTFRVVLKMVK